VGTFAMIGPLVTASIPGTELTLATTVAWISDNIKLDVKDELLVPSGRVTVASTLTDPEVTLTSTILVVIPGPADSAKLSFIVSSNDANNAGFAASAA